MNQIDLSKLERYTEEPDYEGGSFITRVASGEWVKFEDVQKLIAESSPWIDIKDRRPDPDTRILMVDAFYDDYPMTAYVDSDGRIEIEEYRDRRICSDAPDEPTFWMYVPEPPKKPEPA